jgi:hypothetical protein
MQLNDQAIAALLPEHIAHRFRHRRLNKDLVVTLSPTGAFILSQYDFGNRNMLMLTDQSGTYFTQDAEKTAAAILKLSAYLGRGEIIFVGSSKGGFGALLLAGVCARAAPHKAIRALAFGPPTRLYPPNDNLRDIPSYNTLLSKIERRPRVARALGLWGDLKMIERLPNLYAVLAYSELCRQDVVEAAHLCAPHIRKLPVPYPVHGSINPTRMQGKSEEEVSQAMTNQRRAATKDADPDQADGVTAEDLTAWIVGNPWIPELSQLVEQIMVEGARFQPAVKARADAAVAAS